MFKKVSKKVILDNVRCGYVYLEDTNKHGKHSVQGLLKRGSQQHKAAMKTMKEVFVESFGESEWAKKGRYSLVLRDGDADPHNGGDPKEGEEYRDHIFFNASNKRKPGIRNRQNNEPTEADFEEYCYSGAYFALSLTFASHPPIDGGKSGVACYLNNVMFRKPGPRLDGNVGAAKEFEGFAEEADEMEDFDDL